MRIHSIKISSIGFILLFLFLFWNCSNGGDEVKEKYKIESIQSISDLGSQDFSPKGLEIDSNGNIYITLSKANVVAKFDKDRKLIGFLGQEKGKEPSKTWAVFDNPVSSQLPGGFNYPHSLKINRGVLYVTEYLNSRVQKFTLDGKFLGILGVLENREFTNGFVQSGAFTAKGTKNNLFSGIDCINFDKANNMYIADYRSGSIIKFNKDGKYIGWLGYAKEGWFNHSWATKGSPTNTDQLGGFSGIHAISFDSEENIYVSDTANHRVQKFSYNGTLIGWIGKRKNGPLNDNWDNDNSIAESSPEPGGFSGPIDIIFDKDDNLIVLEAFGHRIQKVSKTGKSFGWIGATKDGKVYKEWSKSLDRGKSTLPGGFNVPYHILVQGDNFVVTDSYNNRVQFISIP